MSETLSASRPGQSLLEFLKVRHGDELQCRVVRRSGIREDHAPNGYLGLFADVDNALDDLLGLPGSGGRTIRADLPKCMYKRKLCGLHRQTYLDFVGRRGSETSQDQSDEFPSPRTEPSLRMEASCDHDRRGNRRSPYGSTGEMDHYLDDDVAAGLNDDLDDNSRNDEDDDNGLPSSVDTCDLAEYDKEEVIRKDQVSQHRKQRMVDEDDVRSLVSVSDDDCRAGGVTNPTHIETVTHPSLTTPKFTRKQLSRSPSTPKDTPSFLRQYSDKHSAKMTLYNDHCENSPGYRTLRTVTTLSADPSYDEAVEANEEAVRQRIMAPIASKGHNPANGKVGFVYAFRDNELPFTKIGHTAGKLEARKSAIEKSCGYNKNMSIVAAVKVKAYKRLEEIIHQDLAPHRRFFDCACGDRNKYHFTRHQEYFEIDDNTALTTLQLWADFVERQPWEQNPLPQQGTHLKSNWHDKLLTPSRVEPSETHDSHDERIKRWRKFLDIPLPEYQIVVPTPGTRITSRPSISPLTTRSTTPKYGAVTDTAKISAPDYTPSKPSRTPNEDTAEAGKPVKVERSLFESLKQASCSIEPSNLTNEQDPRSTAQEATFNLPHRPFTLRKDAPMFNDPAASTASNLQTESASYGHSLSVAGRQSFSMYPSLDSQQSNDQEVVSSVGCEVKYSHQSHDEDQPSDTVLSASLKIPENATLMIASPLVQSTGELVTYLLAKKVRPLPARAISVDIWQFRWPLACFIAFAVHSPHIPAGLSFLMWSIFLPFFVAELRGWTRSEHDEGTLMSRAPSDKYAL